MWMKEKNPTRVCVAIKYDVNSLFVELLVEN